MPTPEEEVLEARKKKTLLLMAGGAFSLILPLGGVVYLRVKEARVAAPPNTAVMFERREAGEAKISVSQTVTIVSPAAGLAAAPAAAPVGSAMPGGSPSPATSGDSLGMVKGDGNFLDDKKPEAPAVSTQTAPAKPPVVDQGGPIASKTAPAKKGGKKPFVMPKLQSGKGFTGFKGSPRPSGGGDIGGVAAPQGAGGMNDMLKNLPPGAADNPELQKLLQNQGK